MADYFLKLKSFYKDKNKKNYLQIIYELLKCTIQEKELPGHYLTRFLYRKDINNYLDYISNKKCQYLAYSLDVHNENAMQILTNKLFFDYYFRNSEIKIPKILAFNMKNKIIIDDNTHIIEDYQHAFNLFKKIASKTKTNTLFIKPVDGGRGKDCFKFIADDEWIVDSENKEKVIKFIKGNYIIQEVINQHTEINKIYAHSINTLRLDTYLEDTGEINVMSSLMRFGKNGSNIDNVSAGGFYVPIDIETGIMKETGLQSLEYGGGIYYRHPDTGFEFKDFKIPYFEEAKKLVKKAGIGLPNTLVGWDVAISDNGPILVEGNCSYSIAGSDIAYGGFKNHPIYKKILDKYIK